MSRSEDKLITTIWRIPLLRHILLVAVIGAALLSAYDLLRVYPSFERLLVSAVEKEAERTATHLLNVARVDLSARQAFSHELPGKSAWTSLREAAVDFGLWKTRVFSPDGEIIFSTLGEEIGNRNTNDYFFNKVAKGETFSKVERKQGTSMEGEVLPVDVVEVYVPVSVEGQFLGALEIYYNVSEEWQMLQTLLLQSGSILLALVSGILLAMIILVVRTARESQQLALTRDALSTQERLFRDVIDAAQDGIMVTDPEQKIRIINPAFSEMTGYDQGDLVGKTPSIFRSGHHDQTFFDQMWQSIEEHKRWRGEIWNRRQDGSVSPELVSISTIEDESGELTHYVGIFTDISTQKASEQRYQAMAYHDPLSGLPNRLLLMDRLQQAIHTAERQEEMVAVLFMDLDGFKQVNDSAGHEAGDLLLQEIAERLKSAVRKEDTVARMGGDEFTMVIRGAEDRKVLEGIAEKIIAGINEPVEIAGERFTVGVSIGISRYPVDSKDPDGLVCQADAAMYEAKKQGRNRFIHYQGGAQPG
ncbi:MAG: diguanylate cyclase [Sedimenticola sp.]